MHLQKKTLEKLRDLINEETEYRSGPKLVQFLTSWGLTILMDKVSLPGGCIQMRNYQ